MTPAEYEKLVKQARKTQLTRTAEQVERLQAIYTDAARSLAEKIARHGDPDEPLSTVALQSLLEGIQDELVSLRGDTFSLLDAGMSLLAQTAADRETLTEELAEAPRDGRLTATLSTTRTLSSGDAVTVRFGGLARAAVEHVAARVYSDGYNLSDRLYSLDRDAKKTVADAITQGVAEQTSARELGKRIQDAMAKAGTDCPRYRAATIAQTEINNAHREAHFLSLRDADGQIKPSVAGVGWRLSPSHPRACRCDLLASDDGDGLGAGNYLVPNAPTAPHPRCLCFTVTLLTDYPDLQFPGKEPRPEDVPDRLRDES